MENNHLFDENELAETLSNVTRLVESAARSDDDFAVAIDGTHARTIKSLEEFLKVISEEEAGVAIESGGSRCELSPETARIAYDRVSVTKTADDTEILEGFLRGLMLNSWRFDFTTTDGKEISGKLSEDLEESYVKTFFQHMDTICAATFETYKITFKNGREKVNYTLLSI